MSKITKHRRSKAPITGEAMFQLWLCPFASPLLFPPSHTPQGHRPGDDALGQAVSGDGEGNLLL